MITPKQLLKLSAATTGTYTVTANQKLIVKKVTASNPSATPTTVTASLAGVAFYTTRTLGPFESADLTLFQNAIALPGDILTFTSVAAINFYASGVETPASPSN
jgi:hypothetical protein